MDLTEAHRLAVDLLDEHGLDGWRVELDRAKTRAGVCRYDRKVIGLSRVLTGMHSRDEVRDTILHEVAHALAGPRAGHGPQWQAVARTIGCTGQRCVPESAPRAPGAWTGVCPAGHTQERHRAPERVVSCRRCSPTFDPAALFDWRWRGLEVPMHPRYVAELAQVRAASAPVQAAAHASAPARPQAQGAPRPPSVVLERLPVGTSVRIIAGGRFAGVSGRVEKRGRTRYHVRTKGGLVTVPFALVTPAPDGGSR